MGVYLGSSPISVYMSGQDAGPKRQEKTVTAGISAVTVTPDSGSLLSKVVVNPTPSQVKSVVPGAVNKTVSPDEGKLLSSVTIEGDADLVASNIKEGINIFGVVGALKLAGLYVWKRKSILTNLSFTLKTNADNDFLADITNANFDTSKVDANFFDGFTSTSHKIQMYNGELYMLFSLKDEAPNGVVCTYDSATASFDGATSLIGLNDTMTFSGYKISTDAIETYVVSDSESAYPDGDVQDGYWYERVSEGVSGIDYGEVTGSYEYGYTITVNHNLGVIPTWVAIIPKTVEVFEYTANMNINGRAWMNTYSGLSYREVNITKTANSISFEIANDDGKYTDFIWFALA